MLARAVDALDRVNKLLSDKNIATISGTFTDVHALTSELASRKDLIAHLDETIQTANETTKKISNLTDSANQLVNGDAKRTLKNLADAADEIKATATDGREAIAAIKGPTVEFTSTGLPQLSATIIQMQRTAESLSRLVDDIQQNPRQLLGKPAANKVELKP